MCAECCRQVLGQGWTVVNGEGNTAAYLDHENVSSVPDLVVVSVTNQGYGGDLP